MQGEKFRNAIAIFGALKAITNGFAKPIGAGPNIGKVRDVIAVQISEGADTGSRLARVRRPFKTSSLNFLIIPFAVRLESS